MPEKTGSEALCRTLSASRVVAAAVAAGCALAWSAVILVCAQPAAAQNVLADVSCASNSFCAALPSNTPVVETANPLTGAPWSPTVVDGDGSIVGISCAAPSLCVAVDVYGSIAVSTNASSPTPTWSLAHVDGTIDGREAAGLGSAGPPKSPLEGISCPYASFCAAVDGNGNVLTSTAPAAGASAWQITNVDGSHTFESIACASASLCVAADVDGDISASANPAGGAGAWSTAHVDSASGFYGIACPSESLCVAVDSQWNVLTSATPSIPSSWTITGHIAAPRVTITASAARLRKAKAAGAGSSVTGTGNNILSCPAVSLCAITSYFSGQIFTSADPGSSESTWTPTELTQEAKAEGILDVACPSPSLCVGSAYNLAGVTSTQPTGGPSTWKVGIPPGPLPESVTAPPMVQLSEGTLTGVARAAPSLTFTLASPPYLLPIRAIEVDTEPGTQTRGPRSDGMKLSSSAAALSKGISVSAGGESLPIATEYNAGLAMIYLTKAARTITVHIASPALSVINSSLQEAARHGQHPPVEVFVNAWDEIGGGQNKSGGFFFSPLAELGQTRAKAAPTAKAHASLTGIAEHKPRIALTIAAPSGEPVKTLTLAAPPGLTFPGRATRKIIATGARRLKITTTVRRDRLTVTLAVPARTLRILIPVVASRSLTRRVRAGRARTLHTALVLRDAAGNNARIKLTLRAH